MGWTALTTFHPGDIVDAADFQAQVSDNLQYLKDNRVDFLATPLVPPYMTTGTKARLVDVWTLQAGADVGYLDIHVFPFTGGNIVVGRLGRNASVVREYYHIQFVVPPNCNYEINQSGDFAKIHSLYRDLGA